MAHTARAFVLREATYRQMLDLKPNTAVLPWGSIEAHNYHLPHGSDTIEASALGETAVEAANKRGASCILLPTVPYGVDHTQTTQVATITMRAATQKALLYDVADSLLLQGIERLVVLNFHGANDFHSMIRDVMFELPIFIIQIDGWMTDPKVWEYLDDTGGIHANEFETSIMMHLTPNLVAPLETAGAGEMADSKMPTVTNTPGVWCVHTWNALTRDTGCGNPRAASAEKGEKIMSALAGKLADVLVEFSRANEGDYPFVIRRRK